jgi:hypothetical protein
VAQDAAADRQVVTRDGVDPAEIDDVKSSVRRGSKAARARTSRTRARCARPAGCRGDVDRPAMFLRDDGDRHRCHVMTFSLVVTHSISLPMLRHNCRPLTAACELSTGG